MNPPGILGWQFSSIVQITMYADELSRSKEKFEVRQASAAGYWKRWARLWER
jgi:hypothetical protein